MICKTRVSALILISAISTSVVADDHRAGIEFSGFLSDYRQLELVQEDPPMMAYLAPGGFELFGRYDALLIDQPEIWISPDSKYGGAKPDEMKALSDEIQAAIVDELSSAYRIADAPGPSVLYVRMAASNLHLKKKSKLLDYTPVGLVTNVTPGIKEAKEAVKRAVLNDYSKRLSLIELTVEVELLDSLTGDRIAAMVEQRGQARDKEAGLKQGPTSWEEVDAMIVAYAQSLGCRFGNARVPESERKDCRRILPD